MINFIHDLPIWKKYGFIFSALYFLLVVFLVVAGFSGIGGTGENDIFMWLLIYSVIPLAWLLARAGITVVVSNSIPMLITLNLIIFFVIGSAVGTIMGKVRSKCSDKEEE